MAQGVVAISGDQNSGEKNIPHLPVEEVHPVVRLRHQGGLGFTCDVTFRALRSKERRTQNQDAGF